MLGSLIKMKSQFVSSMIILRLRKLRFKPSKFQDKEVKDLVQEFEEDTKVKDDEIGAVSILDDTDGVVAPTEVVGLSKLVSLTGW